MQEEDRRARVEQAAQVVYEQLRRWARERNPASVATPQTPPPSPIKIDADTDREQDEPPSLPVLDAEPAAATSDEETESENETENESEEGDPFSRWRRKHAGKKKKAAPESKTLTRKRPPEDFHAEKKQDDGKVGAEEAA
eukprot:scaffold262803_cov27-Attheya_sp.AAC.1